ncbi:MAG: 4-alpha-glucanotransferase [Vicinamibacterales bacterium]
MTSFPARDVVRSALDVLGVRNLVFGIHDAACPSGADEDLGVGSPYGDAAARLVAFVHDQGFNGLQLGPQGALFRGRSSPYDGTLFSRNPCSLAIAPLARSPWARPRDETRVAIARRARPGTPADRDRARRSVDRLLDDAAAALDRDGAAASVRDARARFEAFRQAQAWWLVRDARYFAIAGAIGHEDWRRWPASGPGRGGDADAGIDAGARQYALAQWLVHEQHADFHARTRALGLRLYADFQAGASPADAWGWPDVWLPGYRMGAPPSRTNPEGQAWHYPVLDPRPVGTTAGEGAARRFFLARVRKLLDEFDAMRIDHPHALVCPWVYRDDGADPLAAVRAGARLFESPDLPDHPALAPLAIARPDQIDRRRPRHADDWVSDLDDAQVTRYAAQFATVTRMVRDAGGEPSDLACEVLSTQPLPLARVMDALGLGRFRVTQKLDPDDPSDVYRGENAEPRDWIMVGNHDTLPVWGAARRWVAEGRAGARAAYLAGRLRPPDPAAWTARVATDPAALARASLADLFVGPARNVFVYFSDVFGSVEPYNRPGTVQAGNWSERLPAEFEALHAGRAARGEALDLPGALATAIEARGPDVARAHVDLLGALRARARRPIGG